MSDTRLINGSFNHVCIHDMARKGMMNGSLTPRAKDKDLPGVLQAIVVVVPDGYCGCEEPSQVFEELRCRCRCHDDREDRRKESNGPSRASPPVNLRLTQSRCSP